MIPDDPVIGCECDSACSLATAKTCCPALNSPETSDFPYTKYGYIRLDVGRPIYECNKRCKCGPDCYNRVVQKGRKVSLRFQYIVGGCVILARFMQPMLSPIRVSVSECES